MIRAACLLALVGLATLLTGALRPGGPSATITTFVGMPAFGISALLYLVHERDALRRALARQLAGGGAPSDGSEG